MSSPITPSGSSGNDNIREDQVNQAVRFLSDPRVQSSNWTIEGKEAFLRQKGLTDSEIAASLSRSISQKADIKNFQVPSFPHANSEPVLWSVVKSIFSAIGAVAIGVVGYHMYLDSKTGVDGKKDEKTKNSNEEITNYFSNNNSENINSLIESINTLKSINELRYKEIMSNIRDISYSINSNASARKPGGSVVLTPVSPEPVLDKQEEVDTEELIEGVRSEGSMSQIGLVLLNLVNSNFSDINKKINISSNRFKNIFNNETKANKLLTFCGFQREGVFLVFNQSTENVANSKLILSRINATSNAPAIESRSTPSPWLVPGVDEELER